MIDLLALLWDHFLLISVILLLLLIAIASLEMFIYERILDKAVYVESKALCIIIEDLYRMKRYAINTEPMYFDYLILKYREYYDQLSEMIIDMPEKHKNQFDLFPTIQFFAKESIKLFKFRQVIRKEIDKFCHQFGYSTDHLLDKNPELKEIQNYKNI